MDANFRLKRKERGVKEDPELGPGWAYFVDGEAYMAEIGLHEEEIEVSVNGKVHACVRSP